jgi:hypothetical protein
MNLYSIIVFIIVQLFLFWLFLFFLDFICPSSLMDIFRVKKIKNDEWRVQVRSIISPIWKDCGKGDILGMEFYPYKFSSYESALSKMKYLKKNRIL